MRPFAIGLALMGAMLGCQKGSNAAVDAMKELTTQLEGTAQENNTKLVSLATAIAGCEKEIAEVMGEPAVITTKDSAVTIPALAGDATTEALTALKSSLNDAIASQKKALTELQASADKCQGNLTTAKEAAATAAKEAEDAAAAEAEATKKAADDAAAAKKKAASRRAAAKKKEAARPEAVKVREAQGKSTSGMGSR